MPEILVDLLGGLQGRRETGMLLYIPGSGKPPQSVGSRLARADPEGLTQQFDDDLIE
jgi:hypothetical protein